MKKYKKFLAVLMVIAMVFSVVSCGKAPEQELKETGVSGASSKVGAEMLNYESGDGTDATGITEESVENIVFTSEDGKVTYEIEAEVNGGDISTLPVITVAPAVFTSAELEKISNALADGSMVNAYNESVPRAVLEDMLAEKTAYISDRDYLMEYYSGNEEIVDIRIDEVTAEIKQIEEDLADCPEYLPVIEPDYTYKPDTEYNEGNEYVGSWYRDNVNTFRALTVLDGSYKEITVGSRTDSEPYLSYILFENDFRYGTESQRNRWKCYQTEPFTDEDIENAKTDILNTLSDMGLGNWRIVSCEAGEFDLEEWYEGKNTDGLEDTSGVRYDLFLRLEPEYNDVPLSDGWGYRTPAIYDSRDYDSPVEAPYMTVTYSGGKIISFEGVGLLKTVSESDEITLLSYDEAVDAVCERLAETWSAEFISEHCVFVDTVYLPEDDAWEYMPSVNIENASAFEIKIDRMELVYVRTELSDEKGSFELVPAWAVYGKGYVTQYTKDNGTVNAMAEIPYGNGEDEPLLFVNAIDGTRIMLSDKY